MTSIMKQTCVILLLLLLFTRLIHAQPVDGKYVIAELQSEKNALRPGELTTLTIQLTVKPGFHAQSNKPLASNLIPTRVRPLMSDVAELGTVEYPPGEVKDYPLLGKLSVYENQVQIKVPVSIKSTAPGGATSIELALTYQACNDQLCFPPETLKLKWNVTIEGAAAATTTTAPATTSSAASIEQAKPQEDQFAFLNTKPAGESAKDRTLAQAFLIAIFAGLLFNIMPCVLPVLPLKVLGFYEASQHSRSKAFLLGTVFSLGVISAFAVLAILILGLKQFQWGDIYSKGWFIWTIVTLITLLGTSLLVGQSINLPASVYNFNPRHDTVSGNYFWGILTTIFATPCTAPLFPGILLWATAQPVAIGVSSMLMVGVGMSLPYLILSAMPEVARKFPRAGAGSEVFKQMLGCLMIVSAGYFAAGRLIHGVSFWWAVFAMVAAACIFLIVRTIQLLPSTRAIAISSVIAIFITSITLWWTIKITGVSKPISSESSVSIATDLRWTAYSDEAFLREVRSGRPVLVKFTANWCATCQFIEGSVYSDESIWSVLKQKNIAAIKVDLTDEEAPGKNLLLRLNPAGGIPLTAIWFSPERTPIVLDSVYTTADLKAAIESK